MRLITLISFFGIIVLLKLFTNISWNIIVSIAIIMIFLEVFTFAFETEGHDLLKIFVILTSFVGLPIFVLLYLGIFNSFSNPLISLLFAVFIVIFGAMAIFTIVKLNYVEIEYDWIDEK